MSSDIEVAVINQLSDNYSYVIYAPKIKKAIIIDPAESKPIIDFLKKKYLSLQGILITHHHSDHTSGIRELISFKNVVVYSSNLAIPETTQLVKDMEIVDFGFINFKVLSTPGHTLDHIIFYNATNNLLFSGDTLFSLGCGRVFEGSYEQMFNSLQRLNELPNKTYVYCGHEYTHQNYKFLNSVFFNHKILNQYKNKIDKRIKNNKRTIPFILGDEKIVNPFLVSQVTTYNNFMRTNNFDKLNFFKHLRSLKDNF
jgi:hydroxyacylglutathione hydrolase